MDNGRDEHAGKDRIDGCVGYNNGQPPAGRRRTVPRGSPFARQARARGGLGGRRARRLAPVPGGVRTPGGRRIQPIGAAPDRLARLLLRPPPRARAGRPRCRGAFAPPEGGGSGRSERPPTDWRDYFFVHPRGRALVGNGGFTGDPDDSGVVEIGYEIAPEHRNRGFATEAARAMIGYAFAHADARVEAVVAHTLAETNASNVVLRKAGMSFVAEVDDPEVGKAWRWRISREEYRREGAERSGSAPIRPGPDP